MTYAVFLVSFVGALQIIHRNVIVLSQPLHHKRLEPTAHTQAEATICSDDDDNDDNKNQRNLVKGGIANRLYSPAGSTYKQQQQ